MSHEFESPMLEVADLCTYYGTSQVLFDVSLTAPRTGGAAILGLNGSGKTSLLKSIVGELKPRSGQVTIDGRDSTL